MATLADKLAQRLAGEVRFDDFNRRVYSIDASICQVMPQGVVIPRERDDILAALAVAWEEGVCIVPRGAATGTTGGCLGDGLVIDCSRHLRRVLEVNPDERWAICEPGVVQDQLTAEVAKYGLRFGPDTSTGNRATLGGMVGNNSSGAHSMRYGKTVDNVIGVELALADGSVVWLEEESAESVAAKVRAGGSEGRLYETVTRLAGELADEVETCFPKLQRRVSGYNLDEFVGGRPVNLAKLVVGAEGTLGLVTKVKVKLSPSPAAIGLCVVHVTDLVEGLRRVPWFLGFEPFSLELIDKHIIDMGRVNPVLADRLGWLRGDPDGLLVVEFDGESEAAVADRLASFAEQARREKIGYAWEVLTRPGDINSVWAMRKSGVGLLMARRTNEKAIAFLEDLAVPPDRIGDFMGEFRKYIKGKGKDVGLFGHAGVGQIHTRPMMDLLKQHDVSLMLEMMREVTELVGQYGGCISGEHGDGLIRSWLVEQTFGERLVAGFRELKGAFDPDRRMNPGKIVDPWKPEEHLRIGPATKHATFDTQFDFGKDGGFAFAVEMCNGNGECRKLDKGPLCPSFQATLDEYDSTRARATALQAVVRGELGARSLADERLHDVLDLCLQCKGCQTECPSQVDMAKLKSEVLYHYQEANGTPIRSRLFGAVDKVNRLGTMFSPVSNWVQDSGFGKWGQSLLGVSPQRSLPPFAAERFTVWAERLGSPAPAQPRETVVLMVDTYMQHNYPELGIATCRVLHALGVKVVIAPYSCCGRPMISKGLLPQAKKKARRLVAILEKVAGGAGSSGDALPPVIGLEPSCILTIKDEYRALIPGPATERVAAACVTIDEYLATLAATAAFREVFRKDGDVDVLVHGHCHQKAQTGTGPTLTVLRAVPGLKVREIDSGCCGMAGTFGYEAEHYEVSMKVGETRLFPAVRAAAESTVIVADGLSCRSQIDHGTGRQAKHLVEVLAERLEKADSPWR